MVTILSSHQQNAMVSTLNVLLLTINKALPGGRPRIARVSLMVRVKFSLNKFQSSLGLKPAEPLSRFHHLVEYSTRYKHKCGGDLASASLPYIFQISHICNAQHRLHKYDKGQGKDTRVSLLLAFLMPNRIQILLAHRITTALIPIIFKSDGLCILYLSTLFDS